MFNIQNKHLLKLKLFLSYLGCFKIVVVLMGAFLCNKLIHYYVYLFDSWDENIAHRMLIVV